jgi:hypothetical protein
MSCAVLSDYFSLYFRKTLIFVRAGGDYIDMEESFRKNDKPQTSADLFPIRTIQRRDFDLDYCASRVNEHHKLALASRQSMLRHAKSAGMCLIAAKKQMRHGNWGWWLKRKCPTISERTAQAYMQIERRWKELEPNPELSICQALEALKTRKGTSKRFNPDDLLRARVFREFLQEVWKDWTNEEVEHLKEEISWHTDFGSEIAQMIKKLRRMVQRELGKVTTADKLEDDAPRLRWDRRTGRRTRNITDAHKMQRNLIADSDSRGTIRFVESGEDFDFDDEY